MEQSGSLLALRFPKPPDKDGFRPDIFVGVWNELAYFANNIDGFGAVKNAKKYILRFLNDLKKTGASDSELLEQLSDSAAIYLGCCKTDRSFVSEFLGAMHLPAARVNQKIARQIYAVAVPLMQRTGLADEGALLSQALLEGMRGSLPEVSELYDGLVAAGGER